MEDTNQLLVMRHYFDSGATQSYEFRREQLLALKSAITNYAPAIQQALNDDLKKSPEETWVTETGFLLSEISYALKHLRAWMRHKKVATNLLNLPSSSYIIPEPLGVVLVIGPWNYPLQLLLTPMVGAIAAGNCVVLKPSEFAPATGAVIKKIINEIFDKQYVQVVEGDGAAVIPTMMQQYTFDHVFYTGSTTVGKLIYQLAATKLVPVTLELGGKSPCIVTEDADITVTAKRIAMTKFSNCGQMCVAPDYLLVHHAVKEELVKAFRKALVDFFGADAAQSGEYGRIINTRQFDRLVGYLQQGRTLTGGNSQRDDLYIAPTLMDEIDLDSPVMTEEIFGPILPLITYTTPEEAKAIIARNKNPLALYVFSSDKHKANEWINSIPFGGGCVNNAALHLTNHHLPFGGRGYSGSGNYHGKFSFDTFSHRKGVMKTPTWFDPAARYPPFKGKLKLLQWLMK